MESHRSFQRRKVVYSRSNTTSRNEANLGLLSPRASTYAFIRRAFLVIRRNFHGREDVRGDGQSKVPIPFLSQKSPSFQRQRARALVMFPSPYIQKDVMMFFRVITPIAIRSFRYPSIIRFCFHRGSVCSLVGLFTLAF